MYSTFLFSHSFVFSSSVKRSPNKHTLVHSSNASFALKQMSSSASSIDTSSTLNFSNLLIKSTSVMFVSSIIFSTSEYAGNFKPESTSIALVLRFSTTFSFFWLGKGCFCRLMKALNTLSFKQNNLKRRYTLGPSFLAISPCSI